MRKKLEKPNVKVLDTKIEFENEYMILKSESLLFSREKDGIVEQLNKEYYSIDCPSFVVGIVVRDDQLLVVNQYRHPIGDMNTEFVAGMIEDNETPQQAILKELKEEAGILTKKVKLLGKCRPLSGQNCNFCYVFLITDFTEEQQHLEKYEDFSNLSVQWIGIESFKRKIKNNTLQDGVTLMCWALYCANL